MDPPTSDIQDEAPHDHVELSTLQARGAERHGYIWVLLASLAAAIIAVLIALFAANWGVQAPT
jgi:hypothetical protein